MVRKGSKSTVDYVNISPEDAGTALLATTGLIKDKTVDPRKLVGSIHIKKYLADTKINGKVETWITVLKKLTAPLEEGQTREELTSAEVELLEQCKKETSVYLEEEASPALKTKVSESTDEFKNL
jgi:predicted metal-binding protein